MVVMSGRIYYNVLQMRKVITVSLQPELSEKLDKSVKTNKTTRSEIIRKALDQYLFQQETNRIRAKLRPYAEKAGFYSEEDVFRAIS
jgi:metal-responsive CopG/Arc/MetJ family transcriptional regulator